MESITKKQPNSNLDSIRVRIRYEKRGGACFVPHVSLITLFARAALRAGLTLTMTEGFSPHPKISFGPELPAGVVALGELVDVHLDKRQFEANLAQKDNNWLTPCLERWNKALPEGFKILGGTLPPEDSPALGKICQAALYWVRGTGISSIELLTSAKEFYGADVLDAKSGVCLENEDENKNGNSNIADDWLALTLAAPAQNGIGGWIRAMIAAEKIAGWHEVNIVRAAIGLWDEKQLVIK